MIKIFEVLNNDPEERWCVEVSYKDRHDLIQQVKLFPNYGQVLMWLNDIFESFDG